MRCGAAHEHTADPDVSFDYEADCDTARIFVDQLAATHENAETGSRLIRGHYVRILGKVLSVCDATAEILDLSRARGVR